MNGTPKQIAYAAEIKSAMIARCEATISAADEYLSEPGGGARADHEALSLAARTIIAALENSDDAAAILDAFSTECGMLNSPLSYDDGRVVVQALVAAGHLDGLDDLWIDADDFVEDVKSGNVDPNLRRVYAFITGGAQ